jgi:hypothetical protein
MIFVFFFISISTAQDPTKSENSSDDSKSIENTESSSLESPIDENTEPPEMIIFGEREVDIRRKNLEDHLYNSGYREGIKKEGRTVYRPETSWKPSVVVYENGFVELKRTPPRFESYLKHRNDIWKYLACVPPFTIMCVDVNGWMINERKLQYAKEDIVVETHSDVIAWQEALEKMGMEERINNTIPLMLDTVWKQGLLPDGTTTSDPQERLDWIVNFYQNRLCNEYGMMVRDVITTYVEEEISTSAQVGKISFLAWNEVISKTCEE